MTQPEWPWFLSARFFAGAILSSGLWVVIVVSFSGDYELRGTHRPTIDVTCPPAIVERIAVAPATGELVGEEGMAQCAAPGAPCAGYLNRCIAIGRMDLHALVICEQKLGQLEGIQGGDVWTEDDVRAKETDDFPQIPASAWPENAVR